MDRQGRLTLTPYLFRVYGRQRIFLDYVSVAPIVLKLADMTVRPSLTKPGYELTRSCAPLSTERPATCPPDTSQLSHERMTAGCWHTSFSLELYLVIEGTTPTFSEWCFFGNSGLDMVSNKLKTVVDYFFDSICDIIA